MIPIFYSSLIRVQRDSKNKKNKRNPSDVSGERFENRRISSRTISFFSFRKRSETVLNRILDSVSIVLQGEHPIAFEPVAGRTPFILFLFRSFCEETNFRT